jgi:hypothetical protein
MPLAYNSTISIKMKACANCGTPSKIFSKGLCHTCAMQNRSPIKRMSDKRKMEFETESISNLIEDLDAVYSKYIRIKYSNEKGLVRCFTCNCEKRYQDMQLGHYASRQHLNTRYMEVATRVQCVGCNCLASGNLKVFAQKLNEEQAELAAWITEQSHVIWKPSHEELKGMIAEYRNKLKVVQLKLKV